MLGRLCRRLSAPVLAAALFGACSPTRAPAPVPPAPAVQALAGAVVDGMQRRGQPVGFVLRYTMATDPDHQLGRPGSYVSRADFSDTRLVPGGKGAPSREDASGSVEVYATVAEAQSRYAFFQAFEKDDKLIHERAILEGAVLLRLSQKLSGPQVDGYDAALKTVLGLPAG
ncbi:MAG TPA: hypothetical protein VHT97_08220 [Acidimicrobiales bacterium]|jgi:hypothetical protein|nr:hypothetical protein [Acidimicrobiales bacterium]